MLPIPWLIFLATRGTHELPGFLPRKRSQERISCQEQHTSRCSYKLSCFPHIPSMKVCGGYEVVLKGRWTCWKDQSSLKESSQLRLVCSGWSWQTPTLEASTLSTHNSWERRWGLSRQSSCQLSTRSSLGYQEAAWPTDRRECSAGWWPAAASYWSP